MGNGVFTSEPIKANTIVEVSPVIVMDHSERKLLDQTLLHDYIFEWGNRKKQCCMTMVLNHKDGSVDEVKLNHTYNKQQIEWFKAGGALNVIRKQFAHD